MPPLCDEVSPGGELLTRRDRVCLLPSVVERLSSTLWDVTAFRLGRRGRLLSPELVLKTPETAWPAKATAHSKRVLCDEFYDHSVRTWCFGLALAATDGVRIDRDLFYVAAMLHDIGLLEPIAGRCFTFAGAEVASSLAPPETPPDDVEQVRAAILAHIDIREPSDPLARYLQAGSLLDVAGTRITDVDPRLLREICGTRSRSGFAKTCRSRWRRECSRFPRGRAAYARWPGCLLAATWLNALPRQRTIN